MHLNCLFVPYLQMYWVTY